MIDVTAALGGSYCRVLSGQRRPGVGEEGMGWVIDCIEALLPAAEGAGVVLTIENHYKDGVWEYPEYAQSRERFLRYRSIYGGDLTEEQAAEVVAAYRESPEAHELPRRFLRLVFG